MINLIEKIILKNDINNNDIINLEFLTHKISILADVEVLKEYSKFVRIFKKIADYNNISKLESSELSSQLALLCKKIRQDLIIDEKGEKVTIQSLLKKGKT